MTVWHGVFAALLAILCTSCERTTATSDTPIEQASSSAITGVATYRERIMPPEGSVLHLTLAKDDSADSAIVLEKAVPASGSPIEFEIPLETGKIDANARYSLRAALRDGTGRDWFVSEQQDSVVPGHGNPVSIELVRVMDNSASVEASADNETADDAAPSRYRCGDYIVDARFGDGDVTLSYEGENRVLPIARSASGARYAQDGMEFWVKGEEATFSSGEDRSTCTRSDEQTVWEEAQARGVVFRGVGNEPGWLVEVGPGKTPTLTAMLDYGERQLHFDTSTPLAKRAGYQAENETQTAELRLIETSCEDPMSGERFPIRAELKVGEKTYSGCGRHLTKPD